MGRQSTKIDLEEGEDEDVKATKLFLKESTKEKKTKKKRPREEHLDEAETVNEQEETGDHDDTVTTPKVKPPKKRVKQAVKKATEEEATEDKKYQRLILFVGQIPFEATEKDIAKHFEDHGAGKVVVRLLTEKGTNKSRGMAFVDFETPQQLVRGLRVHHTRLLGRAINVERTVGGGGNNEGRKEKLKQLREFQGSKVKKEVEVLVEDALRRSKGQLTADDLDELVVRSLCTLPRDAAKQVLDEILESDIAHAKNKKAWVLGCIKRYVGRLKTGEQFLTLEEEKSGIIEKRKEASHGANIKPRPRGGGVARGRDSGRIDRDRESGEAGSGTGRGRGSSGPGREGGGHSRGRGQQSRDTSSRFKRGAIGSSSN